MSLGSTHGRIQKFQLAGKTAQLLMMTKRGYIIFQLVGCKS